MTDLDQYLAARRIAGTNDDEAPLTVRGVSMVPGPLTTEAPDVLENALPTEPYHAEPDDPAPVTLRNCDGIAGEES